MILLRLQALLIQSWLLCSVRAQMKDISKLFETIMDFKGLSLLVTEKSLIKDQRPVFCFFLPLLDILASTGAGCHLRLVFLSILLYADDMALLAPSLKGLQTLLFATEQYCKKWDVMLNAKKSKNMSFGKKQKLCSLQLDGKSIEWVDSWPYLGVTLKDHTSFNCCIDEKEKSFYRCVNGILRIEGR